MWYYVVLCGTMTMWYYVVLHGTVWYYLLLCGTMWYYFSTMWYYEGPSIESHKHWDGYFKKLRRPGHRPIGTTSSNPVDVGAKWGPRWVRVGSKTSQERR